MPAPTLQLTWAGFDAAVDLIAAQCQWRDRAGAYGADPAGQLLAHALAPRLGLNVLSMPGPGMVELHGAVDQPPSSLWAWPDVEVWVWVDMTPDHRLQSVVKATPGARVLMPWQVGVAPRSRI